MNSIVVLIGVLVTVATGVPVALQLLREHPRGLFILFFAEMWERFSYYGMRGLLVFYLTQHFLFDDKVANGQYGSYATLVYLLPLVGGILADRYLGARKAVAFGALLLVAGHMTMAIEGPPAQQTLTYHGAHYVFDVSGRGDTRIAKLVVGGRGYDFGQTPAGDFAIKGLSPDGPLPPVLAKGSFTLEKRSAAPIFEDVLYLALALIIMGVGFLKSNISTIVGQLYTPGDPRRDPGFTLYYYGVNLGAFWAAILCGYLGETFGWRYGFGLAGLGMLAGYVTFMLGKPLLQGKGEPPDPPRLAAPVLGPISREWLIYLAVIPGLRRPLHGHAMRPHRARAADAGLRSDRRFGGVLYPLRAGGHVAQPVRRAEHEPRADRRANHLPLARPRGVAGDQGHAVGGGRAPRGVVDRHGFRRRADAVVQRRLHPDLRTPVRGPVDHTRASRP
jgi:POT family proton-dependent oligopeptide transporter